MNVAQFVAGEVAKLVPFRNNALLEPNRRDAVAVAVRGNPCDSL
jgi:hypothetical protein